MKNRFALYMMLGNASFAIGVICLVIAVMLIWSRYAHGSSVCLTKSEARQLWPKRHIYWYGPQHCWSNRRGGPPTGIKIDPIKNSHAESLPASVPEDTKPGKADRAEPAQSPRMVRIIPITKPKEWQNDFQDYCCWPPLEEATDIDKERENAFRSLAEKMRKQK